MSSLEARLEDHLNRKEAIEPTDEELVMYAKLTRQEAVVDAARKYVGALSGNLKSIEGKTLHGYYEEMREALEQADE